MIPAGNAYITVEDFKSLQIMFLVFALGSAASLIKMLWGWIVNKNQNIGEKIQEIEDNQEKILSSIQRLEIYMAQVKDAQVSEAQVRTVVRDEINYAEKIRRQ